MILRPRCERLQFYWMATERMIFGIKRWNRVLRKCWQKENKSIKKVRKPKNYLLALFVNGVGDKEAPVMIDKPAKPRGFLKINQQEFHAYYYK